MTILSLDCLTLTDSTPQDLISAAAEAGFDCVSLWIHEPAAFPGMLLRPALAAECAAMLRDTGLAVHMLEAIDLTSEAAILEYRPALEMGATLGAKAASAYNGSNSDRSHVADLLGLFAEVTAEFGIEAVLEPIAMGQTRTPAEASALIRAAGERAGILFDSLHLIRSGCGVNDLAAVPPGLIRYVQLNDGLARIAPERMIPEAMGERAYPGEGEFPLADLAALLPRDVPWAVEAPSLRRTEAGMSAKAQAAEAMDAVRRLLARVDERLMGA